MAKKLLAAAAVLVVLAQPLPAAAAEPGAEELERLVQTIENETERKALLAQLKALIEARRAAQPELRPSNLGAGLVAALADHVGAAGTRVGELTERLADVPAFLAWLAGQAGEPEARRFWLGLLGELAAILGIGAAVEALVHVLLGGLRSRLEDWRVDQAWRRAPMALLRAAVAVAPAIAFAGAAYVAAWLVRPDLRVALAAFAIVHIYLLARFALAVARLGLAPWAPSLRWLPLAAETGQYLYQLTRRFAVVAIAGYGLAEAALYFRLPWGHGAVLAVLGVGLAAMAVAAIVGNRAAVAGSIRGLPAAGAGGRVLREAAAAIWHVVAIGYVVAIFVVSMLGLEDGFQAMVKGTVGTAVAVALAAVAHSRLGRWAARRDSLGAAPETRAPGLADGLRKYGAALRRLVQGAVWIAAAVAAFEVWGVPALAWATGPTGRNLMDSALAIAFVLGLAVVAWEAASAAIEGYVRRASAHGRPVAESARARTLLPLLRNVLFITLAAIVALIVLAELGINIAPLLAGAGVVGLAVGVGGQKLVQDVINGAFILFEDAIAVGDTVEVDGRSGTVEAISLRALRLRDAAGGVHTVPFSAVGAVTNLSREYAYCTMDIGVGYREDVDQVMAVLGEIGAELQADPEFGAMLLEPLEVFGLDRFAESAMVIKARVKTLPLKQGPVGREFNRRMKKAFDARGIEMPFPATTLYFGADKQGRAQPARLAIEAEGVQPAASASRSSTEAAATIRRAKS